MRVNAILIGLSCAMIAAGAGNPVSVYGTWHCSNDSCLWGSVRNMADFDQRNHWIIDRGDGQPSVNLVVLSFVNPLRLLNQTTDSATVNGVPKGMTPAIISYFTSHNIRVMLSIGGITYVNDWNTALSRDPVKLATNAAALAHTLGVGIEIDYEESSSPNVAALETFIKTYRAYTHPADGAGTQYDPTGTNPAARLTIDLAAGDRWLIPLTQKATADWLRTVNQNPQTALDYANAMVPNKQPSSAGAIDNWQEHIDGKPQYNPPIGPLAPAKFTGSLYLVLRNRVTPECLKFAGSVEDLTGNYVQTVASTKIAGASAGMLGYMFWAAECEGNGACTVPPNDCRGGVGVGSKTYSVGAMPPLRQF